MLDSDIYVVNTDGTGLRRLTDDPGWEEHPSWSPDGSKIAWVVGRVMPCVATPLPRGGAIDPKIWVMNADGSGKVQLTRGSVRGVQPAWSPDGTQIAFAEPNGDGFSVVNADGTGLRQVASQGGHPTWASDSEIVFLGSVELSNSYELFILLLTVLSLLNMVALLLPWMAPATVTLLEIYDFVICLVFLFDFGLRMKRASSPGAYFFHGRGWLDLLGSIPSFRVLSITALLRLARLSRLTRVLRLFRSEGQGGLAKDVLANRGQYAGFVTLVLAMTVISVASVLVVQTESRVAGANITTGGDAIWWAIVPNSPSSTRSLTRYSCGHSGIILATVHVSSSTKVRSSAGNSSPTWGASGTSSGEDSPMRRTAPPGRRCSRTMASYTSRSSAVSVGSVPRSRRTRFMGMELCIPPILSASRPVSLKCAPAPRRA